MTDWADVEARIDRAGLAMYGDEWKGASNRATAAVMRQRAKTVLRAAFPELFSDPPSMWLAPWEATESMAHYAAQEGMLILPSGFEDRYDEVKREEYQAAYSDMRDAHLQSRSLTRRAG